MTSFEPDLDDDADDSPDVQQPENNAFKQLRTHARKLEKDLKEASKELEELRTFRADLERDNRANSVKEQFKSLGLTEKQAELFPSEGDVTEEAVRKFAVDFGLIQPSEDGSDENTGFTPAPTEGSPTGSKQLSAEEFWTLYKDNPSEAMAAAKKGRVNFDTRL